MAAWANNTYAQYAGPIRQWFAFCIGKNINPFCACDKDLLEFLAKKFNEGASFGSLNSVRAAVALVSDERISKSENISNFFRGAFRLRPPKPKYDRTWNIDDVFSTIENWFPHEGLSLKELTLKLVILLAIGSAHRLQTLAAIRISNIKIINAGYEIEISDIIKTSRPGAVQPLINVPFLRDKPRLCAASVLDRYLRVTMMYRNGCDTLLLTTKKPYKAATTDTISRWIRSVLASCNIGGQFTAHSTRHASSSAALKKGVSVRMIHRTAGWSENSSVFAKHYNRQIVQGQEPFLSALMRE